MSIEIKELYPQVLIIFMEIINFFVFIILGNILFSLRLPLKVITLFFYNQCFLNGQLQSGNATFLLAMTILLCYLFDHFSLFFHYKITPFVEFNYSDLNILLTSRFPNIVSVMKEKGYPLLQKNVAGVLRTSIVEILSQDKPSHAFQRLFEVRKFWIRTFSSFDGTLKILMWLGPFVALYHLIFEHNILFFFQSLISLFLLILLVYILGILRASFYRSLINSYFSWHKVTTNFAKLEPIYSRLLRTYFDDIHLSNPRQAWCDIKRNTSVRFKKTTRDISI